MAVYPLLRTIKEQNLCTTTIEENYNFYKRKGVNVVCTYNDGKYLPLNELQPDIVFYMQPYGNVKKYSISEISKFALTMYCPYGFQGQEYKNDYILKFHSLLYKYFVEHGL